MHKWLALLLLLMTLAIVGVAAARPAPTACAYPSGPLGAVEPDYYTLADGYTVPAVCTEAGWLVKR